MLSVRRSWMARLYILISSAPPAVSDSEHMPSTHICYRLRLANRTDSERGQRYAPFVWYERATWLTEWAQEVGTQGGLGAGADNEWLLFRHASSWSRVFPSRFCAICYPCSRAQYYDPRPGRYAGTQGPPQEFEYHCWFCRTQSSSKKWTLLSFTLCPTCD